VDEAEGDSEEEENISEAEETAEEATGGVEQSQPKELETEGERVPDTGHDQPRCSGRQLRTSAAGEAMQGIQHISRLDQAREEVRASAV
jgi:hypothetical protein